MQVSASDNDQVASVDVYVNEVYVDKASFDPASGTWILAWNSGGLANGPAELIAKAYDRAGNAGTSSPADVTINDTTPPTVAITQPSSGAIVKGVVVVAASAQDNGAVGEVEFFSDGVRFAMVSAAPYDADWDTRSLQDGPHVLTATATDLGGNTATSGNVSVTVDNLPPSVAVKSPAAGNVSGTVDVVVQATDIVGVDHVDVYADSIFLGKAAIDPNDSTLYHVSWTTTGFDNRAFGLFGVAYDLGGNVATSATVTVTISNPTTAVYASSLGAPPRPPGAGPARFSTAPAARRRTRPTPWRAHVRTGPPAPTIRTNPSTPSPCAR